MRQAALRSNEALQALPMRPDWSRGRTISRSARGDTTESHGPLQRLLELNQVLCSPARSSRR